MFVIPPDLLTRFESTLARNSVPNPLRNYYKKWLRYYLDFCQKYNHNISTKENLGQFIMKLQQKNQTPVQQKQASDAVSLFFSLLRNEATLTATANRPTPRHEALVMPSTQATRLSSPKSQEAS